MKITPSWVSTFETNEQTLIQDAWTRMSAHLIWDKFMDIKQSQTLRELYFWLIESAKIVDEGQGGNQRYDDLAATFFEIDNKNSGLALTLTRNEIQDNVMGSGALKGMPVLDYSANWAKQMGGNAGYWPQQKMFELVLNGEASTFGKAYDGVSFFDNAHLINPGNSATGTFANIFTGTAVSGAPSTDPNQASYPGACPIDVTNASTLDTAATNFNKACGYIGLITQPNGKPRNLVPKYALGGPLLRKRLFEILDTKYFGTGQGSTENVVSKYGIEPLIASEITSATDYYIACEMLPGEGGGLIFQNRESYVLSSFQPETQVQLMQRDDFEWRFRGRNAASYGHPYLLFKVKAT